MNKQEKEAKAKEFYKVYALSKTYRLTPWINDSNARSTWDSKKYSNEQNIIEKQVPIAFESGKSYNLKLILGLTSVKVDAEVSNWEVGTVESNLPQNLE